MLGNKTGERLVLVSGGARHLGVLDDVEKWPLALPGEEFQDWLAAVALAAVVAAVALAAAGRRAPRRAAASKAVCRVMRTQIYMSLKINYPYYSWPRHVFGVFEGLVMRRVQLDKERATV